MPSLYYGDNLCVLWKSIADGSVEITIEGLLACKHPLKQVQVKEENT